MSELSNFSELRSRIDNWDIEAERLLLEKMKIFTDDYTAQFNQFSGSMDNFSLNLSLEEIETNKAYNKLKVLSSNQFIEEILETKSELQSESDKDENEEPKKQEFISDIEIKKAAINLSLQHLQAIEAKKEKERGKEQIEDDTVSVSSSKINIETYNSKYVKMPFIIGSDEFNKDKTLGLTAFKLEDDKDESNVLNDQECKELLSNIKVSKKDQKRWEKVEKKRKKKEEKEKKRESEKNLDFEIIEDEKVKLTKETEQGIKIEQKEVEQPTEPKKDDNNNNSNNDNNNESNAVPSTPPPVQSPPQVENKDKDKENPENNNTQKQGDNKEPMDVTKLKKIVNPFNNVSVDEYLKDEDFPEEEDDNDLFSKKNKKIAPLPNQNPDTNPATDPQLQSQIQYMPQFINANPAVNQTLVDPPSQKNLQNAQKKLNLAFGDKDDEENEEEKNPPKADNITKENKEKNENKNIEKEEDNGRETISKLKKKKTLLIEDEDIIKMDSKSSAKNKLVNSLFDMPEEENDKTNNNENKKNEDEKSDLSSSKKKPVNKALAFLLADDDDD